MSKLVVPKHVQDMYDALVEFSGNDVPSNILYKLMFCNNELLEAGVWRIYFLPTSGGYKGFEMILYADKPTVIEVLWAGSDGDYIPSDTYGDYSEPPYPNDLEKFISTLFNDIYSEQSYVYDMCKNAVVFTTLVGKKG